MWPFVAVFCRLIEAMQSTKLDVSFFPADLRPLHWITRHANSKLTLFHCSLFIDNCSKLQKYCCDEKKIYRNLKAANAPYEDLVFIIMFKARCMLYKCSSPVM